MAQFYPLTVTDIRKTIPEAVVVTLVPDEADAGRFQFTPGQFLTFRTELEGQELRRNYSICAGRGEGVLKIGIKQVAGGAFSTWANEDLRVGHRLETMPPQGRFFAKATPGAQYLGFAGGSGITPVLSILKTLLSDDPKAVVTLVYANRSVGTIMFREELEDLKNLYMGRLSIIHVLEQDAQGVPLFEGRIDAEKCAALFETLVDVEGAETAFICGPEPMMLAIAGALKNHGMAKERIRYELFTAPQQGRLAVPRPVHAEAAEGATLTVSLDGARHVVRMSPGQTVLEAVLQAGIDAPFSCRAGVCSTCICRVAEGEVEMIRNHALEDYEVDRGYALSCQSVARTERVSVVYEDH